MKGKILCPAGCQNPISRITKAKENLKSPRSAGSWRPFKCIFGERKKFANSGPIAPPRSLYVWKIPDSGSLRLTKSKYRPVYQISLFAHLSPGQILVGVATPNPSFAAPAAEKSPKNILGFLKNSSDLHPVFLLSVRVQTAANERSLTPCHTEPTTPPSGNVLSRPV